MWWPDVQTSGDFRNEGHQSFFEGRLDPAQAGRKHVVLRKEGSRVTLSVPKHKQLKPGLLRHLIKAAGLTVEEFESLL